MGAMQRMELRGLNLNYGTKAAIRSLGYGASCKVGIPFKNMCWLDEALLNKLTIPSGGVEYTDLPIRVCVYPSYNNHDADDPNDPSKKIKTPGVLLCSYTWSQDAQRIGSWIDPASPKNEEGLKALLLHNLALLHSVNDTDYKAVLDMITESYDTHHSYDWYADPHTAGAFAHIGPSQFRSMYPKLASSTGKHITIGEAASAHHAWIVGALESAVRGVYELLYAHFCNPYCKQAMELYDQEKVPAPFGPLPAEYTRTSQVKDADGKTVKGVV